MRTNKPKTVIDPVVVDLEKWGRLFKNSDFQAFLKLIEERLERLRGDMEDKYLPPNADKGAILADLSARIDELKKLSGKMEFKKRQFIKLEQEKDNNDKKE